MGPTRKHIGREFLNDYFRIFYEFQKLILEIFLDLTGTIQFITHFLP